MNKADAIIGCKVVDCVIKEIRGNEYTLECPYCHSLYTTTWKLMRNRKTPYCKCNVDPYSKIEDLRGQQFGDMSILELDNDEEREKILREKFLIKMKVNYFLSFFHFKIHLSSKFFKTKR